MPEGNNFYTCFAAIFALFGSLFVTMKFVKKYRADRRRVQLQGEEVSQVVQVGSNYGSIPPSRKELRKVVRGFGSVGRGTSLKSLEADPLDPFGERPFVPADYYPEQPRWIL